MKEEIKYKELIYHYVIFTKTRESSFLWWFYKLAENQSTWVASLANMSVIPSDDISIIIWSSIKQQYFWSSND